jgi:hypothetical protein
MLGLIYPATGTKMYLTDSMKLTVMGLNTSLKTRHLTEGFRSFLSPSGILKDNASNETFPATLYSLQIITVLVVI